MEDCEGAFGSPREGRRDPSGRLPLDSREGDRELRTDGLPAAAGEAETLRKGRIVRRRDVLGDGLAALCGGALALSLFLVLALLGLLAVHGLSFFWQKPLLRVELTDGTILLGEVWARDIAPAGAVGSTGSERIQLKVGNRDLTGRDFVWVETAKFARTDHPADAVVLERLEWGNFYGFLVEIRNGTHVLARGREASWEVLQSLLDRKRPQRLEALRLDRREIGDVNHELEKLRLSRLRLERRSLPEEEKEARRRRLARAEEEARARHDALFARLQALRQELEAERLVVETADGTRAEFPVSAVLCALRPNRMGMGAKARLYASRTWEFISGEPRESNTEGGIFPALFGTVLMVFLMAFAAMPFGVLAALYLSEYARQGRFVRFVRIAVHNLAGVPSIVFGMFGLGFFVYLVGGTLDRIFFPELLPTPTFGTGGLLWASLTLALLTLPVVVVATEEGLGAVPQAVREGSFALGATKWETTRRVVLPAAAPGILTGLILAMARASGEVAPLMIVGMVKLAPALPVDRHFPFLHPERKFMHLGFHIYDVGFQSPNVESTKPLVFATTLLLVVLVTLLNLVAIALRNHLRRKYARTAA